MPALSPKNYTNPYVCEQHTPHMCATRTCKQPVATIRVARAECLALQFSFVAHIVFLSRETRSKSKCAQKVGEKK